MQASHQARSVWLWIRSRAVTRTRRIDIYIHIMSGAATIVNALLSYTLLIACVIGGLVLAGVVRLDTWRARGPAPDATTPEASHKAKPRRPKPLKATLAREPEPAREPTPAPEPAKAKAAKQSVFNAVKESKDVLKFSLDYDSKKDSKFQKLEWFGDRVLKDLIGRKVFHANWTLFDPGVMTEIAKDYEKNIHFSEVYDCMGLGRLCDSGAGQLRSNRPQLRAGERLSTPTPGLSRSGAVVGRGVS